MTGFVPLTRHPLAGYVLLILSWLPLVPVTVLLRKTQNHQRANEQQPTNNEFIGYPTTLGTMDPEQRLPRYKDQVTENDGDDRRDRPLNVMRRPANRRVPVDAPPSVDHNFRNQQQHPILPPLPLAAFPTYKDQVNDTAAQNMRFGNGITNNNEDVVGNTSAIATPLTVPLDKNLIPQQRRSDIQDGRLPDFKDQARNATLLQQQHANEGNVANVVAIHTNLPDYKDQARGDGERRTNTGNLSLPVSKPKVSMKPPPLPPPQLQNEQLPDYKDQIHSVIPERVLATTTDLMRADHRNMEPPPPPLQLPNDIDQNDLDRYQNQNDRDRFLPTNASQKKTHGATLMSHHHQQQQEQPQQQPMLPDYKDQVQSALHAYEQQTVVQDHLGLAPVTADDRIDHKSLPATTTTNSMPIGAWTNATRGHLPDYKDQLQSVLQVQEVRTADVMVDSNHRLPQFKDQVFDESDRVDNVPVTSPSSTTPVMFPHVRLPNYKDQIQSTLRVEPANVIDVVVNNNSRLPQYKDQVSDENDRVGNVPGTNPSNIPLAPPSSRLPDYKDQAQSALQVQHVHVTDDAVLNNNNRLLQYKDQAMDENDRADHAPVAASSSSTPVAPPTSTLPIYQNEARSALQVASVRDASVVVNNNRRLPQYKDQALGEGDHVNDTPTTNSNTVVASSHSRLPDYKDQAQSVLQVQDVHDSDVVVESNNRLPQYKDQALGEYDRGLTPLPTSRTKSTLQQSENRNDSKQNLARGIEPVGNLPDYKDQAIGADDRVLRNQTSPSVNTKDTNPAGDSLSLPPSSSNQPDIHRRQLADADEHSPSSALSPTNTNETPNIGETDLEFPRRTDAATMAFAEPYVDVPVYQASDPIIPQGGVSYAEGVGVLVEIVFDDNSESPETEESPVEPVETEDIPKKYLGFRSRWTMMIVMSGAIALLLGIVIGGICGSGACTRSASFAPEGVVPSLSPMQQQQEQQPTVAYPISFSTTNELYVAVDEFIDAFYGNITRETDVTTVYGPIANWDVSQLTNLALVFYGGDRNTWPGPDIDLSLAVVANTPFNEDVSRWNVSSATTLEGMFAGTVSITDLDLSNWDTSRVASMRGMFHSASLYDGNLESWNVQSVTDFSGMFVGCTSFTGKGLNMWNIESGQLLTHTFARALNFNADLSGWKTDRMTSLEGTFRGCSSFNGTGLEGWNVSAVTSLDSTVRGSTTIAKTFSVAVCLVPTNHFSLLFSSGNSVKVL